MNTNDKVKPEGYQSFCLTKMRDKRPGSLMLNAALGLTGEAGEVSDHVKKLLFHAQEIDMGKFILELGDTLFYLVVAAHCVGATLQDVIDGNVQKLEARYPDGFDEAASVARADEMAEAVAA